MITLDLAVSVSVITGAAASAVAAVFLVYLNWRRTRLAADAVREIDSLGRIFASGQGPLASPLAMVKHAEIVVEARDLERRLQALAEKLESAGLHDERARLADVARQVAKQAERERRSALARSGSAGPSRSD